MVLFLKHVHLQNLCAAEGKRVRTWAVDAQSCAASGSLTGGGGQSYECGKKEHEEMNSRHGDSGRICGPMHLERAACCDELEEANVHCIFGVEGMVALPK